jgi:hypothetical protein
MLFVKACKPYAKIEENIQVNGLSAAEEEGYFQAIRGDLNALMVKHDSGAYPLEVYCRKKARFDYFEAAYLSDITSLKAILLAIKNQSLDVTEHESLIQGPYIRLFKANKLLRHCSFSSK